MRIGFSIAFSAVTSQFADHIIIANQNSTDQSVAICKRYPKVTVIENQSDKYDEAESAIIIDSDSQRFGARA
jgi:hypothetical protein